MPTYLVSSRGSLILKGGNVVPHGGTVEMSVAAAASLPPGTVELVQSAPVVPAVAHVEPVAAKPAPKPSHVAVKAKDTKP